MGWDNFYVNILEVCTREQQGVKENTYLQEYLPLLNTTFSSNFSESEIFQSISSILKTKKPSKSGQSVSYTDSSIFVYKYGDGMGMGHRYLKKLC